MPLGPSASRHRRPGYAPGELRSGFLLLGQWRSLSQCRQDRIPLSSIIRAWQSERGTWNFAHRHSEWQCATHLTTFQSRFRSPGPRIDQKFEIQGMSEFPNLQKFLNILQ